MTLAQKLMTFHRTISLDANYKLSMLGNVWAAAMAPQSGSIHKTASYKHTHQYVCVHHTQIPHGF